MKVVEKNIVSFNESKEDWPHERSTKQSITSQFGTDRANLIKWGLLTGDPLADELADEMHEVGMRKAREQFNQAAKEGITSVKDPFPKLKAFFAEVESLENKHANDFIFDQASFSHYSIPTSIHTIALSAGSLIRVYESPSIAYVLASTGRFIESAERRSVETGKWRMEAMMPGSLRIGKQGYIATLNVRILHAHMRKVARNKDYDEKAYGVPINQIDTARTWLDFTLTGYGVASLLGYDLTPEELQNLYKYWEYLGRLLGVDERFIEGVYNHESAKRIDELLDSVTGVPVEESGILSRNTLDGIASRLKKRTNLPIKLSRPLLDAVTRRVHGDALCDQLGVPRRPVANVALNRIIRRNRAKRSKLRSNEQQWNEAIQENITYDHELLTNFEGHTTYEKGATGTDD